MKRRIEKLIALMLSVVMLAGALPVSAWAEQTSVSDKGMDVANAGDPDKIAVGGLILDKAGPYAKTDEEGRVVAGDMENHTIHWDADTGTLTLLGAAISASDFSGPALISAHRPELTVVLSGTNTISADRKGNADFFALQNTGGISIKDGEGGAGSLDIEINHEAGLFDETLGGIALSGSFQNASTIRIQISQKADSASFYGYLYGIKADGPRFVNSGTLEIGLYNDNLDTDYNSVVTGIGTDTWAGIGELQNSGRITVTGRTTNGNIFGLFSEGLGSGRWENQKGGTLEAEVSAYGGNVTGFHEGTYKYSNFACGVYMAGDAGESREFLNNGVVTASAENTAENFDSEQAMGILLEGPGGGSLVNNGTMTAKGLESSHSCGIDLLSYGGSDLNLTNRGKLDVLATTRGLVFDGGASHSVALGICLDLYNEEGAQHQTALVLENGSTLTASAMASDWVEEAEREQVTARDCQAILCQKVYEKTNPGYPEPPQEIFLGDKLTIQEGGSPISMFIKELEQSGLWVYLNTIGVDESEGAAQTVKIVPPRPSQPSQAEPTTEKARGWNNIQTQLDGTADGETVTVEMNGTTQLPGRILETIAGTGVTLELHMNGAVWSIKGREVPAGGSFSDLDMGISCNGTSIPAALLRAMAGEQETMQLELAHDGAFGFPLTLRLETGTENAGLWADLYEYQEAVESLLYLSSARIGGDGRAELPFPHASSYAVVIGENPFDDVKPGDWFYSAGRFAHHRNLFFGTSETTFSPEQTMTRGMLAAVLWRMAGEPEPPENRDDPFVDVDAEQYYASAVYWARENGILYGVGQNRFAPEEPVTREQLATVLYRYAGSPETAGELEGFADAGKVSSYARNAVEWAVERKILAGKGNGILDPRGSATRAEVAAVLMRYEMSRVLLSPQ